VYVDVKLLLLPVECHQSICQTCILMVISDIHKIWLAHGFAETNPYISRGLSVIVNKPFLLVNPPLYLWNSGQQTYDLVRINSFFIWLFLLKLNFSTQCNKIEALSLSTSQNGMENNATCSWLKYDEEIQHDTLQHTVMNKPSSVKGKTSTKPFFKFVSITQNV
jgi:hypothetical protein